MKLPGLAALYTQDDRITEARVNDKIERKLKAEEFKTRRRELTGEVVRYLPVDGGFKVTCGDDILATLRLIQ